MGSPLKRRRASGVGPLAARRASAWRQHRSNGLVGVGGVAHFGDAERGGEVGGRRVVLLLCLELCFGFCPGSCCFFPEVFVSSICFCFVFFHGRGGGSCMLRWTCHVDISKCKGLSFGVDTFLTQIREGILFEGYIQGT